MATGRTEGVPRDREGVDGQVRTKAATRAEVIEILAGAVLALILQRDTDPSLDGPLRPPQAPYPATSRQIRGSL